MTTHSCRFVDCGRTFLSENRLTDHAEAVHSFGDIRALLCDELKEEFGVPATVGQPGVYVWIRDLAVDWVVFEVEGADSDLYKCDYTIDDKNDVTFGTPVPVVQRTVYEPVDDSDDAKKLKRRKAPKAAQGLLGADAES